MIRSDILLYQEMDRLIVEDAPVVPLWYDEVIHLEQLYVKEFIANGLNLLGIAEYLIAAMSKSLISQEIIKLWAFQINYSR